jgi:hypothetical protein
VVAALYTRSGLPAAADTPKPSDDVRGAAAVGRGGEFGSPPPWLPRGAAGSAASPAGSEVGSLGSQPSRPERMTRSLPLCRPPPRSGGLKQEFLVRGLLARRGRASFRPMSERKELLGCILNRRQELAK